MIAIIQQSGLIMLKCSIILSDVSYLLFETSENAKCIICQTEQIAAVLQFEGLDPYEMSNLLNQI